MERDDEMKTLQRLFLRIEYGWHMVDAYLAACRENIEEQIDANARAAKAWESIHLLENK